MDQGSLDIVGTVIADTYLVEREVGEGGMGTVYVAKNVRLGKRYALKVLNPEATSFPGAMERFKREAITAGRLGHVGIVQVHDFSETDDGRPYMVMDLLVGEDLESRMEREGLLPWDSVSRITAQVCDALAAAHDAGIVHRDLKPANIFLAKRRGEGERAVLLDFGVAKVLDAQRALSTGEGLAESAPGPTPTLTTPGTIVGTPNYMSPEQASGQLVDRRSDVYSMGAVLFHMATGTVPFAAESLLGVLTRIAIDPVPTVLEANPAAHRPEGLDAVLAKAMAKDPSERFDGTMELADALPAPAEVVALGGRAEPRGEPPRRPRPVGPPPEPERAAEPVDARAGDEPRAKGPALSVVLLVGLVVAGIVAGTVAALMRGGEPASDGLRDDASAQALSKEALLGSRLAAVERRIADEDWAGAAGIVATLSEEFPESPLVAQVRERVELELVSATLHGRAAGAAASDAARARQLCEQIPEQSAYRSRPPCPALLAAATPTDAGPAPSEADGGAGPAPEKVSKRVATPARLGDREIERIIGRNRPSVVACFDRALVGGARPLGTVAASVELTIAETGRVSRARLLQAGSAESTVFRNCVENTVRGWRFPESRGSTTTQFRFSKRYADPFEDTGR